jgi:hypothetical protein
MITEKDRLEKIEHDLQVLKLTVEGIFEAVGILSSKIENSNILTQESCSHKSTSQHYDYDGESEYNYESCDECGKEWR